MTHLDSNSEIDKILKDLIVASNGGYWYSYSEKVEIKELAEAKQAIEALLAQDRQELLKRIELPEEMEFEDPELAEFNKDFTSGYKQALSEVQAILKKLKGE